MPLEPTEPDLDRLDIPDYLQRDAERVLFPGQELREDTVKHVSQTLAGGVLSDGMKSHPASICQHSIHDIRDAIRCRCGHTTCKAHAVQCVRCFRFVGPCCRRELPGKYLERERRSRLAALLGGSRVYNPTRVPGKETSGATLVIVCTRCYTQLLTPAPFRWVQAIHDFTVHGRISRGLGLWGRF